EIAVHHQHFAVLDRFGADRERVDGHNPRRIRPGADAADTHTRLHAQPFQVDAHAFGGTPVKQGGDGTAVQQRADRFAVDRHVDETAPVIEVDGRMQVGNVVGAAL